MGESIRIICDYCEKGTPITSKVVNVSVETFSDPVVLETKFIVFIRNDNLLCIGDKDDCNCIESLSYTEINFCPMCGRELN